VLCSASNSSWKDILFGARSESLACIGIQFSRVVQAGEKCERLLSEKIAGLKVRDVQCDELWGYVGMKEKSKGIFYKNVDTLGDAYCFVAIERNTKMILSWHLGRRTSQDTLAFIFKLRNATTGKFQLSRWMASVSRSN